MERRVIGILAAALLLGCDNGAGNDAGAEDGGDRGGEVDAEGAIEAGDEATEAPDEVPGEVPAEVEPDAPADVPEDVPGEAEPDVPADAPGDVPGDVPGEVEPDAPADAEADGGADPWDVTVSVDMDGVVTAVDLSAIERTTFGGSDAVRVTRIIEAVAPATPWNYHYDFVGSDGWDPLVERFDGDKGQVPFYGELDLGFLVWESETDLRLNWDESLGFPGALRVHQMNGGTIRMISIAATDVLVRAGGSRALVDVTTLATVDVVDYRHPEDGAVPMAPLVDLLAAASVTGADALAYRMFGMDGFSNAEDNLMPYANLQHGYIKPSNRGIVLEEAWDAPVCCWRVRDTVVFLGLEP